VRNGRVLTFGFHYRYLSEAEAAKQLIDRGVLGEIYAVQLVAMRRRGIPTWGNFIDRQVSGGGPLLDIGVHVLDLGMWLTGFPAPQSALCVTHHRLITREIGNSITDLIPATSLVEDMATGLVRCENELSVQIDASFLANIHDDELTQVRLLGSDGGLEVFPPRLVQRLSSLLGKMDLVIPGQAWDHQLAYQRQINRFVAACLDREPVLVTPEQAVIGQRTIDLLYESAASHKNGHDPDEVMFDDAAPTPMLTACGGLSYA
jgi:predicted dehydrogenase